MGIISGSRASSSDLSFGVIILGDHGHSAHPTKPRLSYRTTEPHLGQVNILNAPSSAMKYFQVSLVLFSDLTPGPAFHFLYGSTGSAGVEPTRFVGRILGSGDLRLPAPLPGFLRPRAPWPLDPGSFLLVPPIIPLHAADLRPNV